MAAKQINCGRCGKKLLTYDQTSFRRYKSPIKQCKKCQTKYLDPRCHEIAVEGIPSDTFSVTAHLVLIVFGGFLLYRGIHMLSRYQLGVPDGMQFLMPSVFILMGIVVILAGIVEIIRIKTGLKARKYEKLRAESEARMQNKSYAYQLQSLGYPVPEKYL